ncbi:MAG TPA: dephospho-CoA kinase [Woeseiaceae bacterium]|nr:dephospho-CoA kinase [Woeseiaceae bacterium]
MPSNSHPGDVPGQNPAHIPLRIGLTGGIASGKSTVANIFAGLGAVVIDTDVIAREVVEPGQSALNEIRHEFGNSVIDADGRLDRAQMRRIVFDDDDARGRLEAITHPAIQAEAIRQAETQGGDYQLLVVPLLVQSPLRDYVDRILVVDCDENTQIKRLKARDAESERQARRMLAAQASREQRLSIADDVVRNDGDLTATLAQVRDLHEQYLDLARQKARQA